MFRLLGFVFVFFFVSSLVVECCVVVVVLCIAHSLIFICWAFLRLFNTAGVPHDQSFFSLILQAFLSFSLVSSKLYLSLTNQRKTVSDPIFVIIFPCFSFLSPFVNSDCKVSVGVRRREKQRQYIKAELQHLENAKSQGQRSLRAHL